MKHLRSVFLPLFAILLALSLSGCCDCGREIADLQQRVGELETQLQDHPSSTDPNQESAVNDLPPPQRL